MWWNTIRGRSLDQGGGGVGVSDGHGAGHDGQPHPGTCGGILSEVGLWTRVGVGWGYQKGMAPVMMVNHTQEHVVEYYQR